MPMIKSKLDEIFPNKVRIEEPDLVVAKGATIYANISSTPSPRPHQINRDGVKKYSDQLAKTLAFVTDVGFTHVAKLLTDDLVLSGDDIVSFVSAVRSSSDNKFRYAKGDCIIPPAFNDYEQIVSTIGYCMGHKLVDVARKLVSFIPWDKLSRDEMYHYICVLTGKDGGTL